MAHKIENFRTLHKRTKSMSRRKRREIENQFKKLLRKLKKS